MNRRRVLHDQVLQDRNQPRGRGFTLIELLFVIVIGLILTAIAVPLVNNVMTGYRLRSAAASVSGSIQATRYQAIFNGYPFRLVLNNAALTYQVQNDPGRTGAFANYCVPAAAACPVPLAGSGMNLALNASSTFTFSPGGSVLSTTAVGGVTTMVLTYSGKTETVTVSSYGNIKVTP